MILDHPMQGCCSVFALRSLSPVGFIAIFPAHATLIRVCCLMYGMGVRCVIYYDIISPLFRTRTHHVDSPRLVVPP